MLIVQRRTARPDVARPETLRDQGAPVAQAAAAVVSPVSEAMRRVHALAERAATGTINVLITGGTGVGKELLAETVHRKSKRREGPYVCLNCAALSETLLESELFGHERGRVHGRRRPAKHWPAEKRRAVARSFSTKSVSYRWRHRPSYCGSSKPAR